MRSGEFSLPRTLAGLQWAEFPRLRRATSLVMYAEHDPDIECGAKADVPQRAFEFNDPKIRPGRIGADR